jgi:hypothetical protein
MARERVQCRACGLAMRDLEHATFTSRAVYHTSCVEPLHEELERSLRTHRLRLIEGALSFSQVRRLS